MLTIEKVKQVEKSRLVGTNRCRREQEKRFGAMGKFDDPLPINRGKLAYTGDVVSFVNDQKVDRLLWPGGGVCVRPDSQPCVAVLVDSEPFEQLNAPLLPEVIGS